MPGDAGERKEGEEERRKSFMGFVGGLLVKALDCESKGRRGGSRSERKGNRRRKGVCVTKGFFLPDISDIAKHLEQLFNHVMVSCIHRKILLRGREGGRER